MTILTKKSRHNTRIPLALAMAIVAAFVAIPALSLAIVNAAKPAVMGALPAMSIAVTNSSTRPISHLYLSPVDRDNWGPDQLSGTVLTPGQSVTISDVSCGGNEVKVIAEDNEGCFVYGVLSCAQASTGWTVTNDLPRDCGN